MVFLLFYGGPWELGKHVPPKLGDVDLFSLCYSTCSPIAYITWYMYVYIYVYIIYSFYYIQREKIIHIELYIHIYILTKYLHKNSSHCKNMYLKKACLTNNKKRLRPTATRKHGLGLPKHIKRLLLLSTGLGWSS